MEAQQVHVKLEWKRMPGTISSIVATYVLQSIDGEPFRGFGLAITQWKDEAVVPSWSYHAVNGRTYWVRDFKTAERGIKRVIRALRARQEAAKVAANVPEAA